MERDSLPLLILSGRLNVRQVTCLSEARPFKNLVRSLPGAWRYLILSPGDSPLFSFLSSQRPAFIVKAQPNQLLPSPPGDRQHGNAHASPAAFH